MNTKQTLKAAWSLYRVLGLVMILSMVFAAPLVVMAWTEAVPPDAEPGTIVTIKVGDDDVVQYDKDLPIEVIVVEGPNGYMPPCVEVGWGWDDLAEQEVWTCEIELDADPAVAVGEYKYVVLQAGVLMDQGFFTDNQPAASLEQCRNGTAANPSDCLELGGSLGWVNGNAGASNSHHAEGYSIPYRIILTNLPIGETVTLTLGYDIRHSSKTALDFLTSYDRQEPHMPIFGHPAHFIDPTSGVSGIAATNSTWDIPAPPNSVMVDGINQPITRFNALPAAEKKMSLYGGTITGMAYVQPGNFTLASSEAQVSVTFTPAGSTAVLAFGGHIARCEDWGKTDGVCNSAAGISGSPYHMRLKGWTLGNLGSQDRSLAAGAVVSNGTLIIKKVAVPQSTQQFWFSLTGQPDFYLVDNGLPGNTLFQKEFDLTAGIYSAAETVPAGWDLTSATCSDGSPVTAIDLAPAETVTCTFTNTQSGKIIVDKVTVPSGDPKMFTFTKSWGGGGTFELADATTPHDSGFLTPGSYSVSETVPEGWDLTSTVCVSSLGHTETAGALDLNPGETITCTFTNTKRGKIIVDKVTVPSGDPQMFTFTKSWGGGGTFQLADATTPHDSGFLTPGSYSVSETVPEGWDLTSTVCISSLGHTETAAALNLNPGETITCTFTNTKRGKIIIDKNTVPAGDLQLFTFTPSWGTPPVSFQLAHATTPYDSGWLVPGSYTVIESSQAGWDLTGIVCNGVPQNLAARTATINLAAGQTVTCVFTNSKLPELKLVKNVVGGTAMPDDWKLYATAAAPNNGKNFWNLGGSGVFNIVYASVGYVLTETLENPAYLDMYMASAWSCDKAGVLSGSTVTLAYGDKVTCTITNTLLVPGWTPGFWKNHAAGAPHGKDAWQYTDYDPGDLLDDVFVLPGMMVTWPVKGSSTGFLDKTLMEALRFRGGAGEGGAAEILLRAAVASLLNASFVENYGHPTIPNLVFPMTEAQVIAAVNTALASGNPTTMLTLAAELDYINNGSWDFPWHLLP